VRRRTKRVVGEVILARGVVTEENLLAAATLASRSWGRLDPGAPPPRPSRGPSRPLPRVPSCLEVASALTRILLKGRGYARAGAEFGDAAAELSCPAAKYTFSPLTLAALSRRERAVFAGAQSTARAHLTRDRAAARARPLAPPRLQGRRGQGRLAPY
jgi:hypothetical protein